MNRFEIAALGPLVTQKAAEGDSLAVGLVREGARELARLVDALGHRLRLLDAPFAVLPYGGVFNAGPVVLDHSAKQCGRWYPWHGCYRRFSIRC